MGEKQKPTAQMKICCNVFLCNPYPYYFYVTYVSVLVNNLFSKSNVSQIIIIMYLGFFCLIVSKLIFLHMSQVNRIRALGILKAVD